MSSPVIDPAWLADHIGDEAVVVVDCRFVLGDPDAGRHLFERSRLPGARFVDVETELSGPVSAPGHRGPIGGRHPLPDCSALEAALRRVGISTDSHVVAYDQAMNGGAARLWWLLRHHGFERCSVLRGGFADWQGELEEEPPASPSPGDVTLGLGRDDIVDEGHIRRGEVTVIDARARERFTGDVEPVDPVAGHIPGARNVPFADAFHLDASLVREPGPLAASCGSGVTACVLLLGFAEAGRDDVRLYPGSWSDWLARGGEVETGTEREASR